MSNPTRNPPRGSDERFEGRLVDLNTGALRHNHVLVQPGRGVELFIGLGPLAGRALGFAFDREFEPNSFFAHCDVVDQALERGDFAMASNPAFRRATEIWNRHAAKARRCAQRLLKRPEAK